MTVDETLKSIPRDALEFRGRVPRKEFLIKLVFWQVLVPLLLTGMVLMAGRSLAGLGDLAWRGPIYLLVILNAVFLLPVGVRRARDAGYPVGLYLVLLFGAIWAFVSLGMSWPLWGLHAALLLARSSGKMSEPAR